MYNERKTETDTQRNRGQRETERQMTKTKKEGQRHGRALIEHGQKKM